LEEFQTATAWYIREGIDVRAFVLLRPPWLDEAEAVEWCVRSAHFAGGCGVRHISLIPVRGGNGALEWLAARQQFAPPQAASLESALERSLACTPQTTVVTADLWDWERLQGHCTQCMAARRARLERMHRLQKPQPRSLPTCACAVPAEATDANSAGNRAQSPA
jgi:archaeosine synthase beta-subunit